jgi:hypothetical protein
MKTKVLVTHHLIPDRQDWNKNQNNITKSNKMSVLYSFLEGLEVSTKKKIRY